MKKNEEQRKKNERQKRKDERMKDNNGREHRLEKERKKTMEEKQR